LSLYRQEVTMSTNHTAEYDARMKRFDDTISRKDPDRVSVIPWSFHFYPAKVNGMSFADAMNDHERFYEYVKASVVQYQFDMAPSAGLYPAPVWETLGMKTWKWPGQELPENQTFQFLEREVMPVEDYDAFLSNPDAYTANVILPETTTLFEGLKGFPPLHWFFNYPDLLGPYLAMPSTRSILKGLLKIGDQYEDYSKAGDRCYEALADLGFPTISGGTAFTAYDTVGIWLRGNKGTMIDMYRNPDQLLAAIEICNKMQTELAIVQCQASDNPRVGLYVYRCADGFMNDDQFEKFFWPYLLKQIDEIIAAGLLPLVFFEGDVTSRLHYIAELPSTKVALHFDRVDRTEAARNLKGKHAFWGNIPASIMNHGTPEQVENDVRDLIETFAADCGLIVDCAGGITDDAKPENVAAMVEAVHKYGQF
jgi:uroporphyrinogen-III decarboxylase